MDPSPVHVDEHKDVFGLEKFQKNFQESVEKNILLVLHLDLDEKNELDLDNYFTTINNFVNWCNIHFLKLNVKKTKEIIFDFRTKDNNHETVNIAGEMVERVGKYKYLGVTFDENLSWKEHTYKVQTKLNQRMYF